MEPGAVLAILVCRGGAAVPAGVITIATVILRYGGGVRLDTVVVFCGVVPGQEQLNAEYAVRGGAAIMESNPDRVVAQVARLLLKDRNELRAMRRKAAVLGAPGAAGNLVEQLLVRNPDGGG